MPGDKPPPTRHLRVGGRCVRQYLEERRKSASTPVPTPPSASFRGPARAQCRSVSDKRGRAEPFVGGPLTPTPRPQEMLPPSRHAGALMSSGLNPEKNCPPSSAAHHRTDGPAGGRTLHSRGDRSLCVEYPLHSFNPSLRQRRSLPGQTCCPRCHSLH